MREAILARSTSDLSLMFSCPNAKQYLEHFEVLHRLVAHSNNTPSLTCAPTLILMSATGERERSTTHDCSLGGLIPTALMPRPKHEPAHKRSTVRVSLIPFFLYRCCRPCSAQSPHNKHFTYSNSPGLRFVSENDLSVSLTFICTILLVVPSIIRRRALTWKFLRSLKAWSFTLLASFLLNK